MRVVWLGITILALGCVGGSDSRQPDNITTMDEFRAIEVARQETHRLPVDITTMDEFRAIEAARRARHRGD